MKNLNMLFAAAVLFITSAFTCNAQTTTTFYAPPTSCTGAFAVNYNESCSLQVTSPDGTDGVLYQPVFNGRFSYILFSNSGTGVLDSLGYAAVTSHTTNLLSHTDNGLKRDNTFLQGYVGYDNYEESTTFVNQDLNASPFSGSTYAKFTATTRCCSSGRGASQHTTAAYTYFFGSVTK